jgi:hypothetical protein
VAAAFAATEPLDPVLRAGAWLESMKIHC